MANIDLKYIHNKIYRMQLNIFIGPLYKKYYVIYIEMFKKI